MIKVSYILRVISLAILFGGSIATIVAAITLVKAAEAQGIAANVAAGANAPMFLQFSNIVMLCGFVLLLAESLDYALERKISKIIAVRYSASLLCVAATMILFFGIIPPMKTLRATIHSSTEAYQTWQKFHSASRIIFSIIILSSLVSLISPVAEVKQST